MARRTHFERQFFEETGYSETACGVVVRRYDTHRGIKKLVDKINCKNCLKVKRFWVRTISECDIQKGG